MRLLAVLGFTLFVMASGFATHIAAGGGLSLAFIPGLSGVVQSLGLPSQNQEPTKVTTEYPEKIAPAESFNAVETAAGPLVSKANADETIQLAQILRAPPTLNITGRDLARASGEEGQPPVFAFPVDCTPGVDCLISSFVDMEAGDQYRDYTCGTLTYDGHKGTDIRLPSHVEMAQGYTVTAAAPGRVVAVRDEMPDANFNLFGRALVTDRGLGNVVVLEHGNGWRTYYGHMRQNSISVEEGAQVEAGTPLGLIGLSGLTEFPHLHFQIEKAGTPIDPFSGLTGESGCDLNSNGLWAQDVVEALTYPRTLLLRFGFSDKVLNQSAVEYMLFKTESIPADNRALILHAHLSGLQVGDRVEVRVFGPNDTLFAQAGVDIEKGVQSRILRVGKKDLERPPETGTYRGELRYFRQTDTGPVSLFSTQVSVEIR